MTKDSESVLSVIDRINDEFEIAMRVGTQVRMEDYLGRVEEEAREELFCQLLTVEWEYRIEVFDLPGPATYVERFPQYESAIHRLAGHLSFQDASIPSDAATTRYIGPYKLLGAVSDGATEEAWVAQQESPVKRRVIIKVVKWGTDRQRLACFEADRQALLTMDHPNIATVLDVGQTESGTPYLVTEWVKGLPLYEYCDQRDLSLDQRLALLVQVCHALQHAHEKGILHRGLTPASVLVCESEDRPVAKVVDFGLAKRFDLGLTTTGKTLMAHFGQEIGSLRYISPELPDPHGSRVDARTDVYSLGVMLYELLTESTPIKKGRLARMTAVQWLQTIQDMDFPKPSERLCELDTGSVNDGGSDPQVSPREGLSILHGEMDAVVMKALQGDPNRRYESASSLADEVSRYLAEESVHVTPLSRRYLAQTYLKRHRIALWWTTIILGVLVAGLAMVN